MKKTYRLTAIFCLILLATATAMAQQKGNYSMRYVKKHALLSHEGETTVVNVDMEWPEAMDGAELLPLQVYAIKLLFQQNNSDLDPSLQAFMSGYGEEVQQQFDALPDDKRVCYVDIEMRLLSYTPGRYVTFHLKRSVKPASQSSQEASDVHKMVTYDLQTLKPLSRDDILRHDRIEMSFTDFEILLPEDLLQERIYDLSVNDACLVNDKVLLVNSVVGELHGEYTYQLKFSPESMWRYLTKDAKAMLKPQKATSSSSKKKSESKGTSQVTSVSNASQPASLLEPDGVVETIQPEFQVPDVTLNEYLTRSVRSVKDEINGVKHGMVMAMVDVDAQGWTTGTRIVLPLAAAYDREVARVVRGLPRWKPAIRNGEPVATQIAIAFEF